MTMTHSLAPTIVLPALALLQTYSALRVQEALGTLRSLYFPSTSPINAVPALKQTLADAVHTARQRRAGRLVHRDNVPDSGYASAEEEDEIDCLTCDDVIPDREADEDEEELELLRADELERAFAIKWLTGLVKRADTWMYVEGTADAEEVEEQQQIREKIIDDASKLLARFAGDDEPEEAVTREFSFPFYMQSQSHGQASKSPQKPIIVELNDAPLDTTDHTSVGLQSWGSAIILAERICADPERYLGTRRYSPPDTLRVLELGAGTGLLSIATAHIFSRLRTAMKTHVIATDYHPSVLENLGRNVATNDVDVAVEALDWSCPPPLEPCDVVLAADVIYHPEHARWIRECVGRALKEDGVFWLIIPLRTIGRHEGMSRTVEDVFPDAKSGRESGRCLAVVHREEVEKQDGIGRADEGGYRLFEIRWL